jgi:hypothetical protein
MIDHKEALKITHRQIASLFDAQATGFAEG